MLFQLRNFLNKFVAHYLTSIFLIKDKYLYFYKMPKWQDILNNVFYIINNSLSKANKQKPKRKKAMIISDLIFLEIAEQESAVIGGKAKGNNVGFDKKVKISVIENIDITKQFNITSTVSGISASASADAYASGENASAQSLTFTATGPGYASASSTSTSLSG